MVTRSPRPRWAALCIWLALAGEACALTFSTVIIDAGHGGKDGGAVWNGLTEKKLCLDVAQRLDAILRAKGLRTVMIRKSDVYVDLDARARAANRYSKSIYVSIHFNASTNRSVNGIETHYRSTAGKPIALAVQRSLAKSVTGSSRGVSYRDYKVLRATRMPAILVECGFISNRTEARRCGSASHRQALAAAIAQGILNARN